MKIEYLGNFDTAERSGVHWLGVRNKWLDVKVTRRSDRQFDLSIEGTYDGDIGKDITFGPKVPMPGMPGSYSVQVTSMTDRPPQVTPHKFSAWFMLAALHEFWGMGLIQAPHNDWSFIRDRDVDFNWQVFAITLLNRNKQCMAVRPRDKGLQLLAGLMAFSNMGFGGDNPQLNGTIITFSTLHYGRGQTIDLANSALGTMRALASQHFEDEGSDAYQQEVGSWVKELSKMTYQQIADTWRDYTCVVTYLAANQE